MAHTGNDDTDIPPFVVGARDPWSLTALIVADPDKGRRRLGRGLPLILAGAALAVAALVLSALGGCAAVDTPDERRALAIGVIGGLAVYAIGAELGDGAEPYAGQCTAAGYLCITDPPAAGPHSPY